MTAQKTWLESMKDDLGLDTWPIDGMVVFECEVLEVHPEEGTCWLRCYDTSDPDSDEQAECAMSWDRMGVDNPRLGSLFWWQIDAREGSEMVRVVPRVLPVWTEAEVAEALEEARTLLARIGEAPPLEENFPEPDSPS